MILTVESLYKEQDEAERQEGMNLPMFSRSGKSTASQYIVFQNKKENDAESKVAKIIYRGDDSKGPGKKQGLEGVSEQSSESDDDEGSVPHDFQSKAQDTKIPAKKDGKGQAIKP